MLIKAFALLFYSLISDSPAAYNNHMQDRKTLVEVLLSMVAQLR